MGLRINPNHAEGWSTLADLRVLEGRAVEGIESARKGLQLNPHPPGDYFWLLGFAQYAARDYLGAIDTLSQGSTGVGGQRVLAAALAQLGHIEAAHDAACQFLMVNPQFTVSSWAKTQPFRNPRDLQHFVDGYIMAGLPE